MSDLARRYPEIDAIKVAGIVTIVLIHSLRPPWHPGISELERWLGHLTRFGVPGFLFASGFLYAAAPPDFVTTRRRLLRILVPYLIASGLAQLWRLHTGAPSEAGGVLLDLLLGASVGPYYYVFVIAILVALCPWIARMPLPLLYAATGALVASQWFVDAGSMGGFMPLFWHLRSPLLWWSYFALGWVARLHEPQLRSWLAPRRRLLLVVIGVGVIALSWLGSLADVLPRMLLRSAVWLDVYAIVAFIALAANGVRALPRPLRALSDATYTIYLYHMFFVTAVQQRVVAPPGVASATAIGLPWLAGLAGGLAVVWLGQRLLGARSREWVGA